MDPENPQIDISALSGQISDQVTEKLKPFMTGDTHFEGDNVRKSKHANITGSNPSATGFNFPKASGTIEELSSNLYESINTLLLKQKSTDEHIARVSTSINAQSLTLRELKDQPIASSTAIPGSAPTSLRESRKSSSAIDEYGFTGNDTPRKEIILEDLFNEKISKIAGEITLISDRFKDILLSNTRSGTKKASLNEALEEFLTKYTLKTTKNRIDEDSFRSDTTAFDKKAITDFNAKLKRLANEQKVAKAEGASSSGLSVRVNESTLLAPTTRITKGGFAAFFDSKKAQLKRLENEAPFLSVVQEYYNEVIEQIANYNTAIRVGKELKQFEEMLSGISEDMITSAKDIEFPDIYNPLNDGGLTSAQFSNASKLFNNHIAPLRSEFKRLKHLINETNKSIEIIKSTRSMQGTDQPISKSFNSAFDTRVREIDKATKLAEYAKLYEEFLGAGSKAKQPVEPKASTPKNKTESIKSSKLSGSNAAPINSDRTPAEKIADTLSPKDPSKGKMTEAKMASKLASASKDIAKLTKIEAERNEREKDEISNNRKLGLLAKSKSKIATGASVLGGFTASKGLNPFAVGGKLNPYALQGKVTSLFDILKEKLHKFNFKEVLKRVGEGLKPIGKLIGDIKAGITLQLGAMKEWVTGAVKNSLSKAREWLTSATNSALNAIKKTAPGIVTKAGSKIRSVGKSVKSGLSSTASSIGGFFSRLGNRISSTASSIKSGVVRGAKATGQFVSDKAKATAKFAKAQYNKAKNAISSLTGAAKKIAMQALMKVPGISDTIKKLKSSVNAKNTGGMFSKLISKFGSMGSSLKSHFSAFLKKISSKLMSNPKIKAAISKGVKAVKDNKGGGGPIGFLILAIFIYWEADSMMDSSVTKEVDAYIKSVTADDPNLTSSDIYEKVRTLVDNPKVYAAVGKVIYDVGRKAIVAAVAYAGTSVITTFLIAAFTAVTAGAGIAAVAIKFVVDAFIAHFAAKALDFVLTFIIDGIMGKSRMEAFYISIGETVMNLESVEVSINKIVADKVAAARKQTAIETGVTNPTDNGQSVSAPSQAEAQRKSATDAKQDREVAKAQAEHARIAKQEELLATATSQSNATSQMPIASPGGSYDATDKSHQYSNRKEYNVDASGSGTHAQTTINNVNTINPETTMIPTYTESTKAGKLSYG